MIRNADFLNTALSESLLVVDIDKLIFYRTASRS